MNQAQVSWKYDLHNLRKEGFDFSFFSLLVGFLFIVIVCHLDGYLVVGWLFWVPEIFLISL